MCSQVYKSPNYTGDWLPHFVDNGDWLPDFVRPCAADGLVISKTNEDFSHTVFLAFAFYQTTVFDDEIVSWWIDYYGWIEFGFDGSEVYIRNSAVETTGQGLYAGVVPEPSTLLLALSGVALLLCNRRRTRKE